MNPIKAQIKIALGNTLGADIEDLAERYEVERSRNEGGVAATNEAAVAVRTLLLHVTKDLEEGKFADIAEAGEVADTVRLWLTRAVDAVLGVGARKEAHKLISHGKAQASREIMAKLKKDLDAEQAKLDRVGEDGDDRAHLKKAPALKLAERKKAAKKTTKRVTKKRGSSAKNA